MLTIAALGGVQGGTWWYVVLDDVTLQASELPSF